MHMIIGRALLCVLVAAGFARAQGTITGTVVDDAGKPVAGAKVHIAEKKLVVHRLIRFYETDDGGRFHIADVPWGTYVVMAGKEDASYPDLIFSFYNNLALPNVTLAEDFRSVDVIVKIGPKAGVLDLEPVTDSITGKEIRSASVTLRRSENPDLFLSASATQGHIFVPASTNVIVEITAEGYKPWPPAGTAEGKLFLKPEEVKKLRVVLQPQDARPDVQ